MARKSITRHNGAHTKRRAATNAAATLPIPTSPERPVDPRPVGGGFDVSVTKAQTNANVTLFSSAQLEMLSFRRFNPFVALSAASLQGALDSYLGGYLVPAARLWERLAKQHKTIRNVKAKREEAVALRPRVIERMDDSPLAYDQAFVLETFYNNARAGHALNRNIRGGFSKIVMQMMEAKSYGSAAHHLIWNPDSSRVLTLPSGKKVPSLTAQFEYVPMEFFESRTGELRFLGMSQAYTGQPLEEAAWLVTSEEAPLMFAASVLAYYDKLATADMVNFSEKFGTPGIVVHTTAQKGSPEGNSANALTQSLGSNYRGTLYGAPENKIEIVWPSGGTTGNSLPMYTIIEDVKRDLASLYLGADLSTQSRGGSERSVGASVQQEGEERRERADCAWISETLNAGVDSTVLRWYFGDGVPILARVSIDAPKNEDRTILANLVEVAVSLGAQVPIEPVMKRLNVPVAKEGEKNIFVKPVVQEVAIPGGATIATNVAPGIRVVGSDADLEKFLGPLRDEYLKAFAHDMEPLRSAMEHVLKNENPANFRLAVNVLRQQLPHVLKEITAQPRSAAVLAAVLSKSMREGFSQAEKERAAA